MMLGSSSSMRRLAVLDRQLSAVPVEAGVSPELMKPGKAAMCVKLAASKGEVTQRDGGTWGNGGEYGDVRGAIDNVELVDIPPGKVLRIPEGAGGLRNRNESGNGFGPYGTSGKSPKFESRFQKVTGKPQGWAATEIVDYTDVDNDHLIVKVMASALNYPDLSMMTHVYQTRADVPFCLGYEAAGEVIHVCGPEADYGGGLAKPKVGDRVFCSTIINGHSSRIAIPASNCTPIPDNFDYDDAAGYVQGIASAYGGVMLALQ